MATESRTQNGLQQLQSRFGEAFDRVLTERLSGQIDPVFLGMMQYQFGYVDEHLRPVTTHPGKRFRPLLALLACEAVGGRWQDALNVAAAIELLHNFSLVHDDIEDRDPARRHRPTVWKVWGEPQAINAGDAIFAEAVRTVLEPSGDAAATLEVARRLGDVVLRLTEGQYLDMSFEQRASVTPDEYIAMIERKTAHLIAFSLWSGARIGGGDTETRDLLGRFGMALGKAFQIHDDILGIWGAREVTGKEEAMDLRNRKKTLPVLLSAASATSRQKVALETFFARRSDDLPVVLDVLSETRARHQAEAEMERYRSEAGAMLARASLQAGAAEQLRSIAGQLTGQWPAMS